MRKSKIEAELLGAVGDFEEKKNEDRQDYLERLMKAVSKVKDPVWETLSTEAQNWNNAAAQSYKDEYELDDFPDLEEEARSSRVSPVEETSLAPEEPADAPAEKELVHAGEHVNGHRQSSKVSGHATRGRPKKKLVLRESAEFSVNPNSKKISPCNIIKRMVVRKPSATVQEIKQKLDEHGLRVTDITISTLRSSTRDTLRVVNEEGAGHFEL